MQNAAFWASQRGLYVIIIKPFVLTVLSTTTSLEFNLFLFLDMNHLALFSLLAVMLRINSWSHSLLPPLLSISQWLLFLSPSKQCPSSPRFPICSSLSQLNVAPETVLSHGQELTHCAHFSVIHYVYWPGKWAWRGRKRGGGIERDTHIWP